MVETEKIPQHRHCHVCGRAFVGEGRFCSDACKEAKKVELTKKKRQLFIVWILAAGVGIGALIYSIL